MSLTNIGILGLCGLVSYLFVMSVAQFFKLIDLEDI
jgi:hypothetical protein